MILKEFAIITITIFIIMFLLIIFMFIKIQKLSKNNIKENFSSDDLAKVRTEINKIYDMDVEAIRNLGHISKSLLTGTNYHSTAPGTPGDLTIPADNTKFKGKVSVDGGIRLENTTWGKTIAGHPNRDSIGHILSDNQGYKQLMIVGNNSAGGVRKVGIWDYLQMNGGIGLENTTWAQATYGHPNSASIGHIVSDNHGYKKLMIVGNNSAGGVRKVGIWDNLDVDRDLDVHRNLHVGGSITIGNITISANGITIGRTAIDKDGNITYGSIKPNPNNPETLLTNVGDSAAEGAYADRCPEGKTLTGLNLVGWDDDIRRVQGVCR
jgi:hypothetical protein